MEQKLVQSKQYVQMANLNIYINECTSQYGGPTRKWVTSVQLSCWLQTQMDVQNAHLI
jgi:hypothetical protein